MRIFFLILILMGTVNPALAQDSTLKAMTVAIPGGEGGIGFDDMVFSPELHKVLVPAGHTGKLYMIDPTTFAMTSVGGFSSSAKFQKGHKVGISSADAGDDLIFAADHGTHELIAFDLELKEEAFTAALAGEADYVRYVGFNQQVWVTEPHNKQIEIFTFIGGHQGVLKALIHLPTGPESLVIDRRRGHAYTNLGNETAAIDIESHTIIGVWPNECVKSRGNALDEQKGFLFVSCAEGKVMVFDLNHDNKNLSQMAIDPGPDVISYNPRLAHLYITSSKDATLSVLKVSADGMLSFLAKAPADKKSHCVVSDDQNNIWVCDPLRGRLLRYKDTF